MASNKTLKVVAAIVASFVGLAFVIVLLFAMGTIRFTLAMLMLVALLGLYVGFGALIAVYYLIDRLE